METGSKLDSIHIDRVRTMYSRYSSAELLCIGYPPQPMLAAVAGMQYHSDEGTQPLATRRRTFLRRVDTASL